MGTAEEKLQKLMQTKDDIKTAINGSGNTVGDKFSDYPVAISNGKALIASAITDKGVSTSADATFEEIAGNVKLIQSSSGNSSVSINHNLLLDNEACDLYIAYENENGLFDQTSLPVGYGATIDNLPVKKNSIVIFYCVGSAPSKVEFTKFNSISPMCQNMILPEYYNYDNNIFSFAAFVKIEHDSVNIVL